uniref:RRM domain-containing protein n=1 Tax=Cannabis sativa TaxID=3483 RepID=A0A803QM72_CANSA
MHTSGGYTAQVTCLSPNATEKDVYDFFSHCGTIEHVEIIRSGENACTAYVTFIDAYALETAVLLSGATILDELVHISAWGTYGDESDQWNNSSWNPDGHSSSTVYSTNQFVSSPSEAITVAQEVVKTMLAKGYVLGKDALVKAKALDESHRVSATAAAKVAEISNRIGLTDTIYSSMETVKSVDQKFHVSDITRSAAYVTGTAAVAAASVTGRAAMAAGSVVANSTYFSKGALWVSDVLNRAAKAASELGSNGPK